MSIDNYQYSSNRSSHNPQESPNARPRLRPDRFPETCQVCHPQDAITRRQPTHPPKPSQAMSKDDQNEKEKQPKKEAKKSIRLQFPRDASATVTYKLPAQPDLRPSLGFLFTYRLGRSRDQCPSGVVKPDIEGLFISK
jgi:hypothetical protein